MTTSQASTLPLDLAAGPANASDVALIEDIQARLAAAERASNVALHDPHMRHLAFCSAGYM